MKVYPKRLLRSSLKPQAMNPSWKRCRLPSALALQGRLRLQLVLQVGQEIAPLLRHLRMTRLAPVEVLLHIARVLLDRRHIRQDHLVIHRHRLFGSSSDKVLRAQKVYERMVLALRYRISHGIQLLQLFRVVKFHRPPPSQRNCASPAMGSWGPDLFKRIRSPEIPCLLSLNLPKMPTLRLYTTPTVLMKCFAKCTPLVSLPWVPSQARLS